MPTIMRVACRCGGTKANGRCDRCGSGDQYDRTKAERGYGKDWERLSTTVRTMRPLCERCQTLGRVRAATEVHHVVPIRVDPSRRLDEANLMSVCRKCHEELEANYSM